MFTGAERDLIVEELNKAIDIPYLPEGMEAMAMKKMVDLAEVTLGGVIPAELQALLHVEEGMPMGKHVQQLADRFAVYLNKKINIPWVPEQIEAQVFSALCNVVANAMVENTNLSLFVKLPIKLPKKKAKKKAKNK